MSAYLHYVVCWTENDGIYACDHQHMTIAEALQCECLIADGRTFIRDNAGKEGLGPWLARRGVTFIQLCRLGRWNFWTVFIGFNIAFLPMHWTGLAGMPRRIYTYPADMGWTGVNLVTTIGSFILAIGILLLLLFRRTVAEAEGRLHLHARSSRLGYHVDIERHLYSRGDRAGSPTLRRPR